MTARVRREKRHAAPHLPYVVNAGLQVYFVLAPSPLDAQRRVGGGTARLGRPSDAELADSVGTQAAHEWARRARSLKVEGGR